MFEVKRCAISGCYEIFPKINEDSRGRFVKVFHREFFSDNGMSTDYHEEYYSASKRDVIRGMHFQTPPHDHAKMVYCTDGQVLDVLLDLRIGSPTFGEFNTITLDSGKGNFVYMPSGIAHGFCVLSEEATLVYKVGSVYVPESDSGVLWSSIGLEWPTENPVISERDQAFQPLADFKSPFFFREG
jgi:dTDP-4-dehydrorhamnose 3,5-epimerase